MEKYGTAGQATGDKKYNACTLHAGELRLRPHTRNISYLLLFYGNNGHVNAPGFYVVRTLTLLFYAQINPQTQHSSYVRLLITTNITSPVYFNHQMVILRGTYLPTYVMPLRRLECLVYNTGNINHLRVGYMLSCVLLS